MDEKKGVKAFLKKTFELKKKDENESENKAVKKAAVSKTTVSKTAVSKAPVKKSSSSTRASAKAAPKTVPKAAPKTVPKATPKTIPKAAPKTVPKAAPKTAVKTSTASSKTPSASKSPVKKPVSKSTSPTKSTSPAKSASSVKAEPALPAKSVEFSNNMTKADNVRFYIYRTYFKPAKLKGQNKITLNAGDIHTEMGLKSEMPTVTSAMKTRIDRLYDVEILDVHPPGGANSKLTVKYDLRNLYVEDESVKPASEKPVSVRKKTGSGSSTAADSESSYLLLKELEEKLRKFVSERVESRFGKEWWNGTDMKFLADRWNERRIMNDRTAADKKSGRNEQLIHYASFSDYRRIINNPFAWDAFEDYFPDRSWIIQRLKELDPIRNAIMHHTPLEEDDYVRLGLYARDILKIIDKNEKGSKTKTA